MNLDNKIEKFRSECLGEVSPLISKKQFSENLKLHYPLVEQIENDVITKKIEIYGKEGNLI